MIEPRSHVAVLFALAAAAASAGCAGPSAAQPGAAGLASTGRDAPAKRRVVVISIDGLRPELYLDPAAHGVSLPALTGLARRGVHARGVRGVVPTVTYPSHTTMVTGMRPAGHGIVTNYRFDESGRFINWYWEAEAISATTLWQSARAAGATTAALSWPVTVGADIDHNLPEFPLRGRTYPEYLPQTASPALAAAIAADVTLPDITRSDDYERYLFDVAALVVRRWRPELLLLHVFNTDSKQHGHGRDADEVRAAFEQVDQRVGAFLQVLATQGLSDETLIVITGDHGFVDVHSVVHLNAALVRAGLIELDDYAEVVGWRAMAWPSGGSVALMLRDQADAGTRLLLEQTVDQLLAGQLAGAARKISAAELAERGGMPGAEFALFFNEGYNTGKNLTGPTVERLDGIRGAHGHDPGLARMRTGFLMAGPGVRAGAVIDELPMVDIAPTIAAWAGWRLQGVEGWARSELFVDTAARLHNSPSMDSAGRAGSASTFSR
ncbi:MAG: alkaline phosphatase family protein [Proteobacteria bacterium]|nr:alkaline phosphatase family protein [Pseudomonadota bacterium]